MKTVLKQEGWSQRIYQQVLKDAADQYEFDRVSRPQPERLGSQRKSRKDRESRKDRDKEKKKNKSKPSQV